MRKIYLFLGMWAALLSAKAQEVATFEEINLQPGSYYNGSDGAGGFESGGIWFPNDYNAQWNYWSGFSVSNMKDTTTAGPENQYSAIGAGGADSSENYAVVYAPAELNLPFDNPLKVEGFFITNAVYSYLSMRNGDDWTKKFGGAAGTDPDYFRLVTYGKDAAGNLTDSVTFYLADFRSENSEEDYIVNTWKWVDLTLLGIVSEISLKLESTDTGEWGMNTPAYFCIDNLKVSDVTSNGGELAGQIKELKVFPNPVKDQFRVDVPENSLRINLTDGLGNILWQNNNPGQGSFTISALENAPSGIYFLHVKMKKGISSQKIMKY